MFSLFFSKTFFKISTVQALTKIVTSLLRDVVKLAVAHAWTYPCTTTHTITRITDRHTKDTNGLMNMLTGHTLPARHRSNRRYRWRLWRRHHTHFILLYSPFYKQQLMMIMVLCHSINYYCALFWYPATLQHYSSRKPNFRHCCSNSPLLHSSTTKRHASSDPVQQSDDIRNIIIPPAFRITIPSSMQHTDSNYKHQRSHRHEPNNNEYYSSDCLIQSTIHWHL